METFENLFNEAVNTSDKRKKVFNNLIEKTKNEILPKFCQACSNFDLKTVFFVTENLITKNLSQEQQAIDYDQFVYVLAIDVQKQILIDAKYDFASNRYYVPDSWQGKNIKDVEFTRSGILELVTSLNNRLKSYITQYNEKNENAINLL